MVHQVAALEPRSASASAAAPFPDALRKKATQGWEAYQRGDVVAARPLLEAVGAHSEAPPWAIYVLGWTQNAASEAKLAASSWERVRAAVPEFNTVYFDLADAYLQQREFGKAVEVLRQAEARWPKDVDVYNALGVVQLARGALDDAIETFARGVGVNASDATANYNLAKTCELRFIRASRQRRAGSSSIVAATVLQDKERAIEHYRRTIQAGGQFVEQAREGLRRLGAQ
jgi:tetratricopeptide (TPR) repeat protein